MSLMDTIKAARQEAEEAGTLLGGKKDEAAAKSADADTEASTNTGFSRKSAARAKPTREAAGSVRMSGAKKPESEMTKEEKRAQREATREKQDLVYDTKSALLKQMPEYKHTQRVWWGCLIAGIVLTVISFGLSRVAIANGAEGDSNLAMISIGLMALAYVLVIGAFVYDLLKVRPLRKAADEKLNGMTKKRMKQVLADKESSK